MSLFTGMANCLSPLRQGMGMNLDLFIRHDLALAPQAGTYK